MFGLFSFLLKDKVVVYDTESFDAFGEPVYDNGVEVRCVWEDTHSFAVQGRCGDLPGVR